MRGIQGRKQNRSRYDGNRTGDYKVIDFMQEQYIIEQTRGVGNADILVGIPSYNNAQTIGHVVRAVQAGLAKYFPNSKSVIVNSDGGSKDGTVEIVQNTSINDLRTIFIRHRPEHLYKIAIPYHGIPGKGSAFRAIFGVAQALGVKACAVVDSDLRSITPEWVELLLDPIINNSFDYVVPLYKRHKYDGTITNSIIYPFTRALYGKRVRQPIGGDFGFSGKLAEFYLSKNVWETDVARYGIDIWMTTTAIANNYKICQSFLGAKIHDPKDPSADLSSMLNQVVGATFDLMEEYYVIWSPITSSENVPTFGFEYEVGLEPISVNLERMIDKFKLGVKELIAVWKLFLPQKTVGFLQDACILPIEDFRIPDDVWADIIYRTAIASHRRILNREHLLKSLTSLYLGKVASFVVETQDRNGMEVEKRIDELCDEFESKKPILVNEWKK